MFFSTAFLASLFAASTVSAAPLQRRKPFFESVSVSEISAIEVESLSASEFVPTAAVFFLTNEVEENIIIASAVNSDGTLSLSRATSTGGSGALGIGNSINLNPLFSQNSIIVSEETEVLAVVNAGSNTISLFSIDSTNPTFLEPIGLPISSGGEFPQSLAFNSDGSRLCALNGGAVNGVACYSVDKTLGLSPISNSIRSINLQQTTPATGFGNTASQIIFSEDDTQLIVSVKGDESNSGFIALWGINSDGSLEDKFVTITPPGNAQPFSMTRIPGKNALVVPDPANGVDIIDLAGNRSNTLQIPGQVQLGWSSFSELTQTYFITDVVTSVITEISIDDNLEASIVQQFNQFSNAGLIDNSILNFNNNEFLYVLSAESNEIQVINIQEQQIEVLSPFSFASGIQSAGINLNSQNLQGLASFAFKQ